MNLFACAQACVHCGREYVLLFISTTAMSKTITLEQAARLIAATGVTAISVAAHCYRGR